ncbi:MAG: ABC transporter ATP-binding protein [Bacteroidales bacterium]|nr:ABC transporter ATP-binding protein [Bacteroidales bacterium]
MYRRIINLLLPGEKKKGWMVVCTVFINSLLDFIGLASLLPVLYYLLEGGENRKAAIYFALFAFAVIVIKSLLSTLFGRYQGRYLLSLYKRLSFSLYSRYYNNGLLYIREQGHSNLGHAVNYMSYTFSEGILSPMLRMAGDGLLIILVSIALLIYDWRTIAVLYICFIPFIVFYIFFIRNKAAEYGREEFNAKRQQARIVADTFRGYQELEVNGAFPQLQKSFLEGVDKVSENRVKIITIQKFPAFLSEAAVIIGLAVMVIMGGKNAGMLIGLFAVAAFRLLPAVKGILNGYTQIQNSLPSLETIEEGMSESSLRAEQDEGQISFNTAIKGRGLTFKYIDQPIEFADFTINKGEYVGFSGYSGVGKTTLFNLILGFLKPSTGEILVDDTPLYPGNRKSWLSQIGYVPQEVFIFNGTLAENIALGYPLPDRARVHKILEMVSLKDWAASLEGGIDATLGESGGKLSGGQKQRIGIARALYKGASVLLLDEATSALDNATEKEINIMLDKLRGECEGLTILSIAHRESTLSYCSRIINLEENGDRKI